MAAAALGLLYRTHIGCLSVFRHARAIFYCTPLFGSRSERSGRGLFVFSLPEVTGHTRIVVGDNVHILGKIAIASARVLDEPTLTIGNGVVIGHEVQFSINREVRVEDEVFIAARATIADSDGHRHNPDLRVQHLPPAECDIQSVRIPPASVDRPRRTDPQGRHDRGSRDRRREQRRGEGRGDAAARRDDDPRAYLLASSAAQRTPPVPRRFTCWPGTENQVAVPVAPSAMKTLPSWAERHVGGAAEVHVNTGRVSAAASASAPAPPACDLSGMRNDGARVGDVVGRVPSGRCDLQRHQQDGAIHSDVIAE